MKAGFSIPSRSHLLHIKGKPATAVPRRAHGHRENKTIPFSSKHTNKSVIRFEFTGCIYTIIWYPAKAQGASTCHKALSNTRGLGLSLLNAPLHTQITNTGRHGVCQAEHIKCPRRTQTGSKLWSYFQRKHVLQQRFV